MNENSHIAYHEILEEGLINDLQLQVLDCLKVAPKPMSASEIAEVIGRPRDSVSPRMPELIDMGLARHVEDAPCRITKRRVAHYAAGQLVLPIADLRLKKIAGADKRAQEKMAKKADERHDLEQLKAALKPFADLSGQYRHETRPIVTALVYREDLERAHKLVYQENP